MFKCENCGYEFEEPKIVHTTYEDYYGVRGEFANVHKLKYLACPHCNSEMIEEVLADEEE